MTTTTTAAEGGGGAASSSPSPPNLLMQLPPAAGQQPRLCAGHSPVSPPGPQVQMARPTLLMDVAIRCTAPNCTCDCFSPCKAQIRICDGCGHGWVSHALDKLGFRHLFNCHQVELVQPSIAFDVASLMLYGTQAIPVRLKILLDRLFSVLQHEEVLQVLHGFGWTYEDYARGYIIQDPSGIVLDKWLLASREEEPLILQQFLRFGETKAIAQQLLLQENSERTDFIIQPPRTESDIKKFIERTNRVVVGNSIFKHHASHIYSHMSCPMPSLPLISKPSFRNPSSSVSSTQSVSPTISSPVNCTSPMASSPLNKLQNMQPYDFRQEKTSPEQPRNEGSDRIAQPNSYSISSLTSPTTSVPNVSVAASSLSSVTTANNSSTYTTASSERSINDEGVYYSEDDEEDTKHSAINLTRSSSLTTGFMDSVFAAKKVRHLRKSANPMKRRWNPTVLATLSTNPATGKKRVQCHVCLKTFCDKGALKIHFSAVHLREMHKCTVEGCNMMFSSRRSRNRHSANPNPKLHTPNYRRKINPHDGRAANPYPMMPPSGMLDFTNGVVSYSSGPHDGDSSSVSDDEQKSFVRTANNSLELRNEEKTRMTDFQGRIPHRNDDIPLPLTKKFRLEHSENVENLPNEGMDLSMKDDRRQIEKDSKEQITNLSESKKCPINNQSSNSCDKNDKMETSENEKAENAELENHHPVKAEPIVTEIRITDKDKNPVSTKGVRKRKSLNPIKCPTTSDEDLQFVSTDDSSSDTYIDQENDENGLLDSKSDFLSSDGSDSMNDIDDLDDNNSDTESTKRLVSHKIQNDLKISSPPVSISVPNTSVIERTKSDKKYHDQERYNGFSGSDLERFRHEVSTNQTKDNEDFSENPLRHLESLSLGAFTNMMNMNNRTTFAHNPNTSSGVSYHAPGLGLASVTTTTAPHRSDSPTTERMQSLINTGSHAPPPALTSNCHLNNSDTDNSMSDQQMPLPPVYRDASVIGSVEIPVDKENPRRCTACGKIFQNHFGVKTHYQNVHLKLMHKCTVEGCNAAFPSKRSRDRHSANLNLHRKLLSTSSDKSAGAYFDKTSAIYPFPTDTYRGDIFSRFYDHNSLPLSFAEMYHSRLSAESGGHPFLGGTPFAHLPGTIPGFHPAFLPPSTTVTNYKNDNGSRYHNRHEENSGRNSSLSSISNPSSPGQPSLRGSPKANPPSIKLEEDLTPDSEGRFMCTICEKKFHECVVLREHYEKCHTQSLLQCSTNGCNKAFLSRQSRNIHNDILHKEKIAETT
ncbi:zinc finger protein basonuclin-2-like [Uloborus diversus]|uniref:zinc finger protein basonuclin-2-like n=1 Tax=Uloborus diversus TaxID=327109 RepID=UPI002409EBC7|nr:zinc finger protein basonuclin-2-like [Uloborus diversus]